MAIRIDAATDAYQAAHVGGTTYTMLCWAYMSADRAAFSTVFEPASSQSSYIQVAVNGSRLLGAYMSSGTLNSGLTLTVGQWYRIALVSNANSITFYCGSATGALSSQSGAGPASFAPTTDRIGKSVFNAPEEWWNGRFAAFKQWNVALSAAQVEAEFETYMPKTAAGLTRWYPWLSAGTEDYSGAGNALTAGSTVPTTEDGPPIRWARSRSPRTDAGLPPQIVELSGIPSEEAFGTATLTVGPVIGPTGIASAEAFGTLVLAPGPVNVSLTGIPSAEAFGTAQLRLSVNLTGIPSAEAFGTTRLDLRVVAVGIPTAEAFGAPTLQYLQVISPAGIPSAEAFGSPEIQVTIDTTVRVLTGRLRITPVYELLVYGRIPAQSGPPTLFLVDPLDWSKLTWSSALSKPQTLSASCQVSTIPESIKQRLRAPERLPTELWLQRNGKTVFAGPLLAASEGGDEVTFDARGLMAYMDWWLITADLRFTQQDQFVIAKSLVDHWQSLEYGHFGINTEEIGLSGVLRDMVYERKEIHQISKRLEELGQATNGFDSEVDPGSRDLKLWYPTKGVDRSTGPDAIVFDGASIDGRGSAFSVAPGDLATDAYGAGSAAGEEKTFWSTQSNEDLRRAFGRAAAFSSFSEIKNQDELDAYVAAMRDARDQALRAPGRNVKVTPDTDLDLYDVGDVVNYQISGLLGIGGAFRIRSRSVSVEQSGQETVTLEFV